MSTISSTQFEQFCDLVRVNTAIVLEPGKEYLVESRLAPIARRQGFDNVGELLKKLGSAHVPALRDEVLDAMTTNETSFFRDLHPWETLRTEILPELIKSRSAARQLTIWCAACSSGQEPYSLAMLMAEAFPTEFQSWDLRIIATDISPSMVRRCGEGAFSQLEVNRGLPAAMLARHFTRHGLNFVADASLRRVIEVRHSNLDALPPVSQLGDFDLVIVRNVLIYFDDTVKKRIIENVHARMRPTGVLLLGSTEFAAVYGTPFVRHQSGKTTYFRPR
jgi:chemotaxis protein methyltransferase CheR